MANNATQIFTHFYCLFKVSILFFSSNKLTELHVAAFQLHQIFFHCLMSDFLKRKNEEATKELTLPVVAIY